MGDTCRSRFVCSSPKILPRMSGHEMVRVFVLTCVLTLFWKHYHTYFMSGHIKLLKILQKTSVFEIREQAENWIKIKYSTCEQLGPIHWLGHIQWYPFTSSTHVALLRHTPGRQSLILTSQFDPRKNQNFKNSIIYKQKLNKTKFRY